MAIVDYSKRYVILKIFVSVKLLESRVEMSTDFRDRQIYYICDFLILDEVETLKNQ